MNQRNKRRPTLTLGLDLLEGRLAPSGGLAGHHRGAAEVQHRHAAEDKPQRHAAEDNHGGVAHQANDDHGGSVKKGGKDDGPAHR